LTNNAILTILLLTVVITLDFMLKFRPYNVSKLLSIKERRKYKHNDNYNFQNRAKWYPAGWKLNQKVIGDQFSKLHYLACHSPTIVRKKWQISYDNFYNKHFGKNASVRYLNKWSCHSWL